MTSPNTPPPRPASLMSPDVGIKDYSSSQPYPSSGSDRVLGGTQDSFSDGDITELPPQSESEDFELRRMLNHQNGPFQSTQCSDLATPLETKSRRLFLAFL